MTCPVCGLDFLTECSCTRQPPTAVPDVLDDVDGDLDEIEAIAAARAAGHGYRPARVIPPGKKDEP